MCLCRLFPSAGTMLTARLPSHSSELSTSADAASCSERTPSVALSQGCAGSTWSCAVSCWPYATGPCLSRAASGPAACVAPVPHWTAWRSDSKKGKCGWRWGFKGINKIKTKQQIGCRTLSWAAWLKWLALTYTVSKNVCLPYVSYLWTADSWLFVGF